jgi:hypothetical protein
MHGVMLSILCFMLAVESYTGVKKSTFTGKYKKDLIRKNEKWISYFIALGIVMLVKGVFEILGS